MKTPEGQPITEETRVKLSLKTLAACAIAFAGLIGWFIRLESRIDAATDIKEWMRSLSERIRELEKR